ncbi:MAG: efflux RND transporter periplasmic adaptor subunit [Reyranella sp.]|jgi:HlyD family secretion protein|nr:efflux RND transporter periplasmic adaptor subunit [Reyranella sp.]
MTISKRHVLIVLAAGVAALIILAATKALSSWPWSPPASDQLTLYGNVDIRQVDMAFQAIGRVQELRFEEGDPVKAGETLAVLDADTYRDLADLARARVEAQRVALQRLLTGSRPEEIAREKASVEAARAAVVDTELLLKRRTELLKTGNVSRELYDEAKNAYDTARARLDVANQVSRLTEIGPRQEDIDQAKALLKAQQSTLSMAEQRLNDTQLKAPSNAIVLSRIVEPGAMVGPNTPVYTLALTDKVWVRTYISEPDLGRIRPGMAVKVATDTDPARTYDGWIGFISPTAEFTPKTVETTELRTQLVYRLRVFVRDPDDRLRQGMPVTVRVPLGR